MYEQIRSETENAIKELLEKAKLKQGSLVVVGCSSSEILGERIGKGSSPETGIVVAETITAYILRHSAVSILTGRSSSSARQRRNICLRRSV